MSRTASPQAQLDARGLLRFPPEMAGTLHKAATPFVSVFTDSVLQQVGLVFSSAPQPGSFRLLSVGGRPALYLKSALQAAGASTQAGPVELWQEGGLIRIARSADRQPAVSWLPFHCRSSANIPMLALDSRGTLTLDRLCVRDLNLASCDSANAQYENSTGIFLLTFGNEGELAVRHVASHAEISFRGTLTAYGIALPAKRLRYTGTLVEQTLRFSLKDPFLSTRTKNDARILP